MVQKKKVPARSPTRDHAPESGMFEAAQSLRRICLDVDGLSPRGASECQLLLLPTINTYTYRPRLLDGR